MVFQALYGEVGIIQRNSTSSVPALLKLMNVTDSTHH